MVYTVFSKDRKSLQFPVMCNGYITIPRHSGNTPSQEIGLWSHSGGLSFEAVITPYDINGNPDNFSATQKSLSRDTKGVAYLPQANRTQMSMHIFNNTNLVIELVNKENYANPTLPAKYSIKVTMTIGSTTTTLESSAVITTTSIDESSLSPADYLYNNHTPFAKKSTRTVGSTDHSANTITLSGTPDFGSGYTFYKSDGTSLGTVSLVSTNTLTLPDFTSAQAPANGTTVYYSLPQEPLYVNSTHHIAFSYSPQGLMQLFYNGKLVGSKAHGVGGNFSFHASDCYIGQDASSGSRTTRRLSQFMGELHEISILGISKTQFKSTNTLYPLFKEILLYMDFEEANLNG